MGQELPLMRKTAAGGQPDNKSASVLTPSASQMALKLVEQCDKTPKVFAFGSERCCVPDSVAHHLGANLSHHRRPPGAGAIVVAEAVVKAPADGFILQRFRDRCSRHYSSLDKKDLGCQWPNITVHHANASAEQLLCFRQ
jgi:hypothetical protein